MADADVFYCTRCKTLVRGVNGTAEPGPDGAMWYSAECVVCKSPVHKAVYPERDAETPLAPQPQLPYGSQRNLGGIPQRPSMLLWSAFIKALTELLPEEMLSNVPRVASIVWYNYMTMDQKEALIREFEETGIVTIPLDDLKFKRRNPPVVVERENPAPLDSEVKDLLRRIAEAFWNGEKTEAVVDGWKIETKPQYTNRASGELSELILVADDIEIAIFRPIYRKKGDEDDGKPGKRPKSFVLSLFDAGLYSHKGYRSPIKVPGLVVVGALILLVEEAPIRDIGAIKYKKGVIFYTKRDWSSPRPLEIPIEVGRVVHAIRRRFTVMLDVFDEKEEVIPTEIGELVEKIDAKEREFAAAIEKLYEEDPDLAKQSQLDLVKVARLMGDKEYEKLLERRDKLFYEEEQSLIASK